MAGLSDLACGPLKTPLRWENIYVLALRLQENIGLGVNYP